MSKGIEQEIKLLIAKQYHSKIWNMPLIKQVLQKDSIKNLKLLSTYYDTRDYKLANAGMAYRIRKNGKNYEATVKTMGETVGGFSSRHEYTVSLAKKKVTLSGFAPEFDEKLQTLTADDELLKLFDVTINRKICLLQISPETIVEMAVDEGEVQAEGISQPISEIELEIKKGNISDLLIYVTSLAQKLPVFVENRSKFQRGLELLKNTANKVGELSKLPYLDKEENSETEIKKVFYYELDKILVGQNIVAKKDELPNADVLLLPAWEAVLALWKTVETFVPKEDYKAIAINLQAIVQPLRALASLHSWQRCWQDINNTGYGIAQGTLLQKLLLEEEKSLLKGINKDIHAGHYSYQCFFMLAYLTGHSWQEAALLQLNHFLGYCWKNWQKLFDMVPPTKWPDDQKLSTQVFQLAQGLTILGYFVKTGKLNKTNYKNLEELTTRMNNLFQDKLSPEAARLLCKGVNNKLLNRDVGILQGFLLAQEIRNWKKIAKLGEKLYKK